MSPIGEFDKDIKLQTWCKVESCQLKNTKHNIDNKVDDQALKS